MSNIDAWPSPRWVLHLGPCAHDEVGRSREPGGVMELTRAERT